MGAQPKVTIIIPCYNRECYIGETVESMLQQTYTNLELMVVDDGCTDKSRSILEQYKKYLKILEHPGRVNRGQSAALNLGIRSSFSKYIGFLDSDDVFAPKRIEKLVDYLETHSKTGLVYSNGYTIDRNSELLYRIYDENHEEKSDPNRILLDCYFSLSNNALLRRNVLLKAGCFDENFRAAQDHDLAVRIAEITKIAYYAEPLFYYRKHKDSISCCSAMMRWKNGYEILNRARLRYNYRFSTLTGRLAVLNFRLGQCFIENGQYCKAIFFLAAAGFCNPLRSISFMVGRETLTSPH